MPDLIDNQPRVAEAFDAVTVQWLRRQLPQLCDITDVALEPVAFTGATTDMARVRITYGGTTPGPRSMIAKIRGRREVQRQIDGAIGVFERESRFYRTFAGAVPVRSPKCFYIGDGDTTPLLLEDLGQLRMGDQMVGMPIQDAETMMDTLADLHASFWESDALDQPWLLRLDAGAYQQLVTHLVSSGAPMLEQRYAGRAADHVLAGVIAAAPNWGDVLAQGSQGPHTLVHNDCRLDNLFFDSDGQPIFIDWQTLSTTRGIQDVANLLTSNMDSDLLTENWERLIRRWHSRLTERGVSGYSLDQAIEHYRVNAFFPLGTGMALLGAMDIGDGRGLGDAIIVRVLRHLDEIDALAAIEGSA